MAGGFMQMFGSRNGDAGNQNGNANGNANGGGNNAGNGNGGSGDNNNNGGNNGNNPPDLTAGLWDPPEVKNSNGNGNNNNNNNNGNNNNNNGNGNGNPPNPLTAFDEHVKGLGDFGVKFNKEDTDKLAAGDMSVLPNMFTNIMQSTYKRAMMDANQLIASRVEDAVKTAVEKANGARNIDKLVDTMNGDLPFTKDPLIAPVAKTILGKALGKGYSSEDAVKAVAQYFTKVAGAAGDLLDEGNGSGGNMPGRGRFGNSSSNDVDFVELLGG